MAELVPPGLAVLRSYVPNSRAVWRKRFSARAEGGHAGPVKIRAAADRATHGNLGGEMAALREFLMARIDEDEDLAQRAVDAHGPGHRWRGVGDPAGDPHIEHWNPWRVLSGCVTKRLIMAAHRDAGPGVDGDAAPEDALKDRVCATCSEHDGTATAWPCYTLRVLALDYVDHPDYEWEWRPVRPAGARL
jgi:hypothetical protein